MRHLGDDVDIRAASLWGIFADGNDGTKRNVALPNMYSNYTHIVQQN